MQRLVIIALLILLVAAIFLYAGRMQRAVDTSYTQLDAEATSSGTDR